MKIKSGVDLAGVQPQTVIGIMVAKSVYEREGLDFVLTSVTDGKHRTGSLHYPGLAFDCRTWADSMGTQMSNEYKHHLADRLAWALGPQWDVVVESTHIHVEFDPK